MREYLRAHFGLTRLLGNACRNSYAAEFYSMLQTLARRFLFFHQNRYTNLSTICDLHIRQLQAVVDGVVEKAVEPVDARNDYAENFARSILMEMIDSSAVTVTLNAPRRAG